MIQRPMDCSLSTNSLKKTLISNYACVPHYAYTTMATGMFVSKFHSRRNFWQTFMRSCGTIYWRKCVIQISGHHMYTGQITKDGQDLTISNTGIMRILLWSDKAFFVYKTVTKLKKVNIQESKLNAFINFCWN